MLTMILSAIPRIVAAVVVFAIIFFVGKVVAQVTSRLVAELNLDELAKEVGISSDRLKFDELVKYLVLTFAVLLGLGQAFHYLQAQALYELTYTFTIVAFKIVVAGVILFTGAYLGNAFEKRTENKTIGKALKYSLVGAALFVALPYVGISPEIIEIIVLSVSLGVGLAFALAFGLGGREVAGELLRKLFLDKGKGE
jgi:predicted MFS family arabinose efflux permease